jgi:hypothetical protein
MIDGRHDRSSQAVHDELNRLFHENGRLLAEVERLQAEITDAKARCATGWSQLAEAYADRNLLACLAAKLAREHAWAVDWANDPAAPDWPVLLIALPTGQISYHLPWREACVNVPVTPSLAWDGHNTEEKRERIRRYLRA